MLTKSGQWTIVFICLFQREALPGGILLLDKTADSLVVKLLSLLPTDDEAIRVVWSELGDELVKYSMQAGGEATLAWLEDIASHFIRVGSREEIQFIDPNTAVEDLFLTHVLRSRSQAVGQAG